MTETHSSPTRNLRGEKSQAQQTGNQQAEYLGYHDEDPKRLHARAPLVIRLGISRTRLPEQISHLYVHRLYSREAMEARREKAFDAFGKPGRGLKPLSSTFDALSEALGWGPHLRARQLAADWPEIVGASIAAYTSVASYRDGVLIVTVSDTSWMQILRSMEPMILQKVNAWMAPTVIRRLILRGPSTRTRTSGRLRVPRKGVRRDQQHTTTATPLAPPASLPPQGTENSQIAHNGWSDPGTTSSASAASTSAQHADSKKKTRGTKGETQREARDTQREKKQSPFDSFGSVWG